MRIILRKRWVDRPRSLQLLLDMAGVSPTTECSDADARTMAEAELADVDKWRGDSADRESIEEQVTEQTVRADDLEEKLAAVDKWMRDNYFDVWVEYLSSSLDPEAQHAERKLRAERVITWWRGDMRRYGESADDYAARRATAVAAHEKRLIALGDKYTEAQVARHGFARGEWKDPTP